VTTSRSRLISTGAGSHTEAFAPLDWALLSGIALVWGASFLFIEIGLEAFSPGLITWLRITLGFLTLRMFPRARTPVDRDGWPRLILLSFTWVSVPFLLFPLAQQHVDSALAGMLNALVPIFAALIAAVLLRRMPGPYQAAGLVIGVTGAVLISQPAIDQGGSTAWGVLLIGVATFNYGLSINLAVPLQQVYGGPAVMARALGIASLVTLPFAVGGFADASLRLTPVLAMATLGIVGTGVAFAAMALLVGRVGPTRGGVAIFFIPIVSIVLGVAVRAETVVAVQLAGTGLVLLGAALASRRERA
jgi:drug/metabolite transporter (DMT)-like permease